MSENEKIHHTPLKLIIHILCFPSIKVKVLKTKQFLLIIVLEVLPVVPAEGTAAVLLLANKIHVHVPSCCKFHLRVNAISCQSEFLWFMRL